MATEKQKKAVDNLVENRGNVSKAMRDAGYDDTTAKNPKNLTESKGYKELLAEYGLTQELVVTALVDDINAKRKNRTAELKLASDILGLSQPQKVDHTTNGKDLPTPILGGISVHSDSIDTQDTEPKEED